MYPCVVINQDGSSYHIEHEYPHHIITLPLDQSTLSEEELAVSVWFSLTRDQDMDPIYYM